MIYKLVAIHTFFINRLTECFKLHNYVPSSLTDVQYIFLIVTHYKKLQREVSLMPKPSKFPCCCYTFPSNILPRIPLQSPRNLFSQRMLVVNNTSKQFLLALCALNWLTQATETADE